MSVEATETCDVPQEGKCSLGPRIMLLLRWNRQYCSTQKSLPTRFPAIPPFSMTVSHDQRPVLT